MNDKVSHMSRGIIRPAASLKHVNDFMKCVKLASDEHQRIAGLSCIDGVVASTLVPGLALSPNNLALYISQGLNIEPTRYLKVRAMNSYRVEKLKCV